MGKKGKRPPAVATDSGMLTHNPFAVLAERAGPEAPSATSTAASGKGPRPVVDGNPELRFSGKVVVRRETKGRGGKTVTRLSGIPVHELTEVATRLRKALGCGATVEDDDVVLQGALEERACSWLLSNGARQLVRGSPPGPRTNPAPPAPAPACSTGPELAGTIRVNVRRGLRVAVVLKEHQQSGELTVGVVNDLLTSSARHPRGIKVRLDSGQVGRVHRIL